MQRRTVGLILGGLVIIGAFIWWLTWEETPTQVIYGMSFNTPYARELGLDWQETYDAILHDLGVRHLRLAAHWPMVEPDNNQFNFTELDYQLDEAAAVGAEVVLAVGRRLPRWPECHIPNWTSNDNWETQQSELFEYLEVVISRYKDRDVIKYWQVENEPYLEVFAREHCGEFDEDFFEQEIAFIRSLDDTRPLLVTDSGNLGVWTGAYRHGDAFGTSVYVHFWNPELGQFKTILPPWWYRMKANLMALLYGQKETMVIELSAEPWLLEPITAVDVETQYSRMDINKLNDILTYAAATRMEKQYLWGAEWWYWLKDRGHPEMWERGLEIYGRD